MSLRARLLAGIGLLAAVIGFAAALVLAFMRAPPADPLPLPATRIALALAVTDALAELEQRALELQQAARQGVDVAAEALARFRATRTALAQQAVFLDRAFAPAPAPLARLIAQDSAAFEATLAPGITAASADALAAQVRALARSAGRELQAHISAENERGTRLQAAADARRTGQLRWLLAAVLLSLALLVLLYVLVRRTMLRPLGILSRGLSAVLADRPLRIDLPETRDEFGDIVSAIRKLRAQGEHIRRLAFFDAATALPNRNSLDAALRDVHRQRASGGSHGLVLVGIDTYNNARNAFGVRFAEEMMRSLVRHLGALDSLPVTLYRYDPGTFAILVDRTGSAPVTREDLKRVATEAFRRLSSPAQVGSEKILVGASVGASLFPEDARDADELVNVCGEVLRQARAGGSGQLRFGERGVTERLRHQLSLSEQIRVGIRDGRFEPFFQPIIDAQSRTVAGAEILVRWRHPDGRVVLPGEFIVVAEETELIRLMTDSVLVEGCRIARHWIDTGLNLSIAFNLSARLLTHSAVDAVKKALDQSGLPPSSLIAEVTETALFGNPEDAHGVLEALRALGVRLCLDDFGTGYSSLSHLYYFPVDRIKIDPLLARAAATEFKAAEIVRAMVTLAGRLNIQLVCEGVETLEDVRTLQALGCRYMQGFYFSRALPHEEFADWARSYPK